MGSGSLLHDAHESERQARRSTRKGRVGLGFKSIHLVSASPSVVSGFISFSIAGGLLPQEQSVENEVDLLTIENRRATRVRLPLHRHVEAGALFRRFAYARALLPVFARQLREVVVEGDSFSGVHVFDCKPIDGAPGWSAAETELPNHDGHWRVLRFRPADAGHEGMGTAALAIGLRGGVPTAFGPEMPFLWNVAPTSESWGCGYAVNGPFKLDPGRTHVSLDDDATLRAVGGLGDALGKGLIELHDALVCPTDGVRWLLGHGDGRSFLTSLWKVLASGLDNPDARRRRFLLQLHGNGRGLSAWMVARSAVPSGLPAPFPQVLPPLTSGTRIEVADGGLDNADFCHALAEIDDEDLVGLVEARCIVSVDVKQLLLPLCNLGGTEEDCIRPILLRPYDLLRELAGQWDYCLTPDRLHALRPIALDGAWGFIASNPQGATWRGTLKARAADGSLQPLRNLLLRKAPKSFDDTDAEGKDELLRAAFAPENQILDPAYIEHGKDWKVFQWLRVQHRVDAETMAKWYRDLRENLRPAVIRYLLYGELGSGVLQNLVPNEGRPHWLQEYGGVCQLLEDQGVEPWRCQSLLGALFPNRFPVDPSPRTVHPEPETFFQRLSEWWDDDAVRSEVIADYEKRAWPSWLRRDGIVDSLIADSLDHWLALFVLGACQSLGRTRDEQHRRFIELAHERGWWDVFKASGNDEAWMSVLRVWQDQAVAEIEYRTWMSLFPTIYQLSRYQDVYARLLKSAGRRPDDLYQVTRLLAPRAGEALTGAGTHFDAPPAPLNMGLHWVLRELVRLEVVEGEHLYPDCWVPSEQVWGFLRPLGLEQPDGGLPNSQKAHTIGNFLATALGTETPNLHLAFDIPLRHVAENEELRRRLGWEK